MVGYKYGCVMLAGGSGKRMGGRNKAELEYDGKTFAERIASEFSATGMPCYLSSAAYEQQLPDGWKLVIDEVTGQDGRYVGPIGGIFSCLRQARRDGLDGLFFAPCDAPFFNKAVVEKMLEFLTTEDKETVNDEQIPVDALVWKTGDGRVQTTFGWYSVRCIPHFEKDISHNGFKLRKSLEYINCRIIETANVGVEDRCFMNVNNKEDYRKILNEELRTKNLSTPISLEEGIELLVGQTDLITDKELVPFRKALGRTLAENITATHDQPPFPRSPFDGYAIRSADSQGASKDNPVKLKVIGEVDAGGVFDGIINEGEALRIMTGAPVPASADAVIKQEETDYGEDIVNIYREMRHNQNVCAKGEDYCKGVVLLTDRTYIGAVETGIIASTGRTETYVYRRPRAVVISTGDELSMPGDELRPGKIYDSNLFTIEALLTSWGVDVTEAMQVPDEPEKAAAIIKEYAGLVDVIVTTGGVSVGKKDIMHDVYAILGVERTFWKIGIKPGAAMMSGRYKGKSVLSLSGNPYAAFVDLHLAVRPVIMAMNGNDHFGMVRSRAKLMSAYDRSSPIRRFVRAYVQDGKAFIEGHLGGNGDIASGRGINALIDIPAGSDALEEGEEVSILFL